MTTNLLDTPYDDALREGARNAVRTCLAVEPHENVVLLTDMQSLEIGAALAAEVSARAVPNPSIGSTIVRGWTRTAETISGGRVGTVDSGSGICEISQAAADPPITRTTATIASEMRTRRDIRNPFRETIGREPVRQ